MQNIKSTIGRVVTSCCRHLLPRTCLLCACTCDSDGLDLCDACHGTLPAAAPATAPPFALIVCPWVYAYPLDHCIHALKFQGERAWARVFGMQLAAARRRAAAPAPAAVEWPDLIVPVPLHVRRLRERGYNQSADLARFAALALALPLDAQALERRRATGVQSSLPASARAANVAAAFRATRALKGLRIALVDDVLTTGSTAAAAAAALIAAGAGGLELWVVARSARGQLNAARRIRG